MLVGDVFDFGNDAIQPTYVYKIRHCNALSEVGESIYKFTRETVLLALARSLQQSFLQQPQSNQTS